MKNISIIVILVFSLSCEKNKNPFYSDSSPCDFAIYLLHDPKFDYEKILDKDYSDFQFTDSPWLTDIDIEFYDWSSHCIYLKIDKRSLFPQYDFKYFLEQFRNKMFVVVANGEISYPAQCNYNNFLPIPALDLISIFFFPDDILYIDWYFPFSSDRRNDERVKEVLIQKGLFHAGLEVHMDELDAVRIIENADTSTIEYTFTVTNKDEDNLYIIDPDIVGKYFHQYTNGPEFMHEGERRLYESTYRKHYPLLEDWDPSWYIMIKTDQSITRTVRLKGYPRFPPGEYAIRFRFGGPIINKEHRYTADGRYWIGGGAGALSNYSFIYLEERMSQQQNNSLEVM